jgi:hypothetical protein
LSFIMLTRGVVHRSPPTPPRRAARPAGRFDDRLIQPQEPRPRADAYAGVAHVATFLSKGFCTSLIQSLGAPRRAHPQPGFRTVPARNSLAHQRHRPGRSQSSAKSLLTAETTRVLRATIKALLDGDRSMALPRPNPLTPPTEGAVAPQKPANSESSLT